MIVLDRRRGSRWITLAWVLVAAVTAASTVVLVAVLALYRQEMPAALVALVGGTVYVSAQRIALGVEPLRRDAPRPVRRPARHAVDTPTALIPVVRGVVR